jgi:hypothetical protein
MIRVSSFDTLINIKWYTNNVLKISMFSIGTASLPVSLLGLSIPQALLADEGVLCWHPQFLITLKKRKIV